MKKIIALLLAVIMTFSLASVAFATEGTEAAPETEGTEATAPDTEEDGSIVDDAEELLGEYSWILDLPADSLVPALKIAKILLKFLKVYVKICSAFGLDPLETAQFLFDFVGGLIEDNTEEAPETEEPSTAPAAVAA